MIEKAELLQFLSKYEPLDSEEDQHYRSICAFISSNDDLFSRKNNTGHITVSAVVTNTLFDQVLFIWHEKLQRWLQPGGHVEIDLDSSLADAAARECMEETYIDLTDFSSISKLPFDLDVHKIPARKEEAEHYHFDFRFLFVYEPETATSSDYKWISIDETTQFETTSIARFVHKIKEIKYKSDR